MERSVLHQFDGVALRLAIFTRSDWERLLERVEDSVKENSYDPQFNVTSREIVANHRRLIVSADSDSALEGAVTDMPDELGSSGLSILAPHTAVTPRNSIKAISNAIYSPTEGLRRGFQDAVAGGMPLLPGLVWSQPAFAMPGDGLASVGLGAEWHLAVRANAS